MSDCEPPSADTIKSMAAYMTERMAHASSAAGGAGAMTAAPGTAPAPSHSLPHSFCVKMEGMMAAFHSTFPDNVALEEYLTRLRTQVLGNAFFETAVIDAWHQNMCYDAAGGRRPVSLYVLTQERRIDELFESDLTLFKLIDAAGMYYSPTLEAEDRDAMCEHLDGVNSVALMYSNLPPDMPEMVSSVLASVDLSQPVTSETMQNLFQNVMGTVSKMVATGDTSVTNPAAMEQLTAWGSQLCASLVATPEFGDGSADAGSMEGGASGLMHALRAVLSSSAVSTEATGMDMGALLQHVVGEASGVVSLLSGHRGGGSAAGDEDDLDDEASTSSLMALCRLTEK